MESVTEAICFAEASSALEVAQQFLSYPPLLLEYNAATSWVDYAPEQCLFALADPENSDATHSAEAIVLRSTRFGMFCVTPGQLTGKSTCAFAGDSKHDDQLLPAGTVAGSCQLDGDHWLTAIAWDAPESCDFKLDFAVSSTHAQEQDQSTLSLFCPSVIQSKAWTQIAQGAGYTVETKEWSAKALLESHNNKERLVCLADDLNAVKDLVDTLSFFGMEGKLDLTVFSAGLPSHLSHDTTEQSTIRYFDHPFDAEAVANALDGSSTSEFDESTPGFEQFAACPPDDRAAYICAAECQLALLAQCIDDENTDIVLVIARQIAEHSKRVGADAVADLSADVAVSLLSSPQAVKKQLHDLSDLIASIQSLCL